MFYVNFKFPDGTTISPQVDSVPKVGEFVRLDNELSVDYYRVSAIWHGIFPSATSGAKRVSIDVILELP
jgi:hypothetical protein